MPPCSTVASECEQLKVLQKDCEHTFAENATSRSPAMDKLYKGARDMQPRHKNLSARAVTMRNKGKCCIFNSQHGYKGGDTVVDTLSVDRCPHCKAGRSVQGGCCCQHQWQQQHAKLIDAYDSDDKPAVLGTSGGGAGAVPKGQ